MGFGGKDSLSGGRQRTGDFGSTRGLRHRRFPSAIDFKWADNIQQTGDWTDFTINGDAAPNDRFNYRATLRSITP